MPLASCAGCEGYVNRFDGRSPGPYTGSISKASAGLCVINLCLMCHGERHSQMFYCKITKNDPLGTILTLTGDQVNVCRNCRPLLRPFLELIEIISRLRRLLRLRIWNGTKERNTRHRRHLSLLLRDLLVTKPVVIFNGVRQTPFETRRPVSLCALLRRLASHPSYRDRRRLCEIPYAVRRIA